MEREGKRERGEVKGKGGKKREGWEKKEKGGGKEGKNRYRCLRSRSLIPIVVIARDIF